MGRWTVSAGLSTNLVSFVNGSFTRYITRSDGSPLMDALVLWRNTALQSDSADTHSRAPSPSVQSDEELLSSSDEREELKRSASEPLDVSKKPTPSSWSRWWSRSRNNREGDGSNKNRPELRGTASESVSLGHIEEEITFTATLRIRQPIRDQS